MRTTAQSLLSGLVVAVVAIGCGGNDTDSTADTAGTIDDDSDESAAGSTDDDSDSSPSLAASGDRVDGEVWDVVEVVDGDTIRVTGASGEERVRLIGINTPEIDECFSDEATAALRDAIDSNEVRLVRDVSETDQFGRLLRFVELEDGTDIGGEQVRRGFAVSRRYEPDVSRNRLYDDLQSAARAARRGQWSPEACGPGTMDATAIEIDIHADAPGDDNHNLNEEWVRFTNAGSTTVDLDGWQIADESASHRYRFADLTLATGDSVTVFTGCGSDRNDPPVERYWCNEVSAVWNNSGDTVFLRDPNGNNVATHTYRE